jgi:hypothetical protein
MNTSKQHIRFHDANKVHGIPAEVNFRSPNKKNYALAV